MNQAVRFHWYLIKAQLPPRLTQVQAHLVIQKNAHQQQLPLSVTYKGRLFEIVRLEQAELPLRVELDLGADPSVDPIEIRIQPVSRIVAIIGCCTE